MTEFARTMALIALYPLRYYAYLTGASGPRDLSRVRSG
jgi:hypothetical protein